MSHQPSGSPAHSADWRTGEADTLYVAHEMRPLHDSRCTYETSFDQRSFASAIVYRTGASVESDLLLGRKDRLTDPWILREQWTAAIGSSLRKPTLTFVPTILPCSCA